MPSEKISQYYESGSFALFGMSKSRGNFAWVIYNGLLRSGKIACAVHPDGGNSRNLQFYRSLDSLPEPPVARILCLNLRKSLEILQDLKNSGMKKVWFQQGSYNDSILDKARKMGFNPITGCFIMYLPGASFPHRLDRFLIELFSKGPR